MRLSVLHRLKLARTRSPYGQAAYVMHKRQLWWCCDPLKPCLGFTVTSACTQVREPRAVLKEFGTVLSEDTVIRVHDSTADLRWAPLPGADKRTADYRPTTHHHACVAWNRWRLKRGGPGR